MPNTNESETGTTELARVAVKCPQFWKDNPIIWFSQVESQFITSGITQDNTKYHIVVASIETEILAQVSDIITSPPVNDMYKTLKNRLIEVFSDSEERRLKKLLQDIDLGDKRPSALLRQMHDLAGDSVDDKFLRSLWLQRLPTQMQAILSTSSDELNKLAMMADKISDVSNSNEIHSATVKSTLQSENKIVGLSDTIITMQTQINELSKKLDKALRFRSRSQNRDEYKRRDRSNSKTRMCWYHFRFRDRANKCIPPCSFKPEN